MDRFNNPAGLSGNVRGGTMCIHGIVFRELTPGDLSAGLLQNFNRYQEVNRFWFYENNEWKLKPHHFVEEWDGERKVEIVTRGFAQSIKNGGSVFGAYDQNNRLIGFANIVSTRFGSRNQYIQLKQIHVSREYRNRGIGKQLFALCVEKAKALNGKKLYISANASEETQGFYKSLGCVDAVEKDKESVEQEPYDRQMEYVL
jgi:ribosomal protein S18 acetylase RimI-like enzyme